MTGENNKLSTGQIIYLIFNILLYPILLLVLSKSWFWPEGWIFIIWFLAAVITSSIYLYLHDPALLKERFKLQASNQKGWDKYFLKIFIIGYLVWFVIMPLDAKRYHWTADFPIWLKAIAVVIILISTYFMFRAIAENTFASPMIRIQKERSQKVISTGVYGFVRHPMYFGGILFLTGTPLLLNSQYGFLIGVIMSFLLAVRILGEEKMLEEELEGYVDYKKKVKYRLIPFIW